MGLAQRFGGRPIAVALEQVRGALVFMLTKYEHLVLFPVHPATLASYRKSFQPSGAKGDPQDASLTSVLSSLFREDAGVAEVVVNDLELDRVRQTTPGT